MSSRVEQRAERDRTAAQNADWLTAPQAAIRLSIHPATIRKLARAGRLPSHGLGRLRRFKKAEVDALLTQVA